MESSEELSTVTGEEMSCQHCGAPIGERYRNRVAFRNLEKPEEISAEKVRDGVYTFRLSCSECGQQNVLELHIPDWD